MHQHSYLLADALRRERQLQRPQHLLDPRHLRALPPEHRFRRGVARALVRLARAVEPGVAGAGGAAPVRIATA